MCSPILCGDNFLADLHLMTQLLPCARRASPQLIQYLDLALALDHTTDTLGNECNVFS